jgi:dihydrofolate reductase
MAIIAIVAVAKNLAIGRGGKLPWHYPADLKFFRQTTTGNAIVMGHTTYESIGRALPNRVNIVLSRTKNVDNADVKVMRSVDEVLEFARTFDGDVFIIGGAKTYENFAAVIDKWLVTEVPETVEDADTFIDEGLWSGFALIEKTELDDGLQVKTFARDKA